MAFSYKRSLTIDHTKVPNTDQTSFPVLVSLTDVNLKSAANGGHVQSASGYDIYFYSDSALTTRIPAERELYTASTGAVVFWVNVPSVSHSTDTVFYMAYGDSGISTDPNSDATYGKTQVWDSHYKLVMHMADNAATIAVLDSTSNGANGTMNVNSSTVHATGQIGGGFAFGGTTGITFGAITTGLTSTFSAWVKMNSLSGYQNILTVGSQHGWWMNGGKADWFTTGDHLASTAVTIGQWAYITVVQDGSNVNFYFNGAADGVATGAATSYDVVNIGADSGSGGSGETFNGTMDEVRISTGIARSADWIATEYNNQTSPSTFFTFGPENTLGSRTLTGIASMTGIATLTF